MRGLMTRKIPSGLCKTSEFSLCVVLSSPLQAILVSLPGPLPCLLNQSPPGVCLGFSIKHPSLKTFCRP